MRAALLFLVLSADAAAVELRIQFGALERMLAERAFTQDGRSYFHGSKESRCNFAYLEKPQVRGESGRLRMKARFSGRSALNLAGQCVGLGDGFDVVILACPPTGTAPSACRKSKSPAKAKPAIAFAVSVRRWKPVSPAISGTLLTATPKRCRRMQPCSPTINAKYAASASARSA